MSDPLTSLKKNKRPPLFLPEMPTPSLTPRNSIPKPNLTSSDISTSPKERIDPRETMAGSSMSNYYLGYSRHDLPAPGPHRKLSIATSSSDTGNTPRKTNFVLNEISSSRVPFKNKIDDTDLMDEVTTKMAVENLKSKIVKVNSNNANTSALKSARKPIDSTPNDMDLMQLMMGKIKRTEARCAIFEAESAQKDLQIKSLQMKIENMKTSNSFISVKPSPKFDLIAFFKVHDSPSHQQGASGLIHKLEKENLDLRNKISDMEQFLSDYGLRWIGDKEKQENYKRSLSRRTSTTAPAATVAETPNNEFECNYDLVIENINELNSMTDYNEPTINYTQNGAKFETTKSIQLTLYANGIALYEGPFRSFDEAMTRKFCIDIMDGYFPSELEAAYPDGVPFSLVDKREVFFKNERNPVFTSKGYRLGSPRTISPDRDKNQTVETQLSKNPMTIEQFLNKLPTSVVKNSKLINIREDLAEQLNANSVKASSDKGKAQPASNNHVISTPAFIQLQVQHPEIVDQEALFKICPSGDEISSPKVATIRVKSLSSTEDSTYLIKMFYTDTVQQLKDHIKMHRSLYLTIKNPSHLIIIK